MALPSGLFSKALTSLFARISDLPDNLDTSHEARGLMKREGRLISQILGNLEGGEDEKWLAVSSVLLMRCWDISKARILVCWVTLSEANGK